MPTPKSVRLTSKTRGRGVGRHVTLRPSSGGGLVTTGVKAKTLPKTLRLAPEFEVGLVLLKSVLGKAVNKMVNEAVSEYIQKRTAEVETNLSGVLEQVKAYRRADPQFKQALAQFVRAEARHGGDDSVEGVVVDVEPPTRVRKSKAKSKTGPTQTMVRELLKASS